MSTVIEPGNKVRVAVTRRGFHFRNFSGVAGKWHPITGLLQVVEDGTNKARYYSSDNVRKIK